MSDDFGKKIEHFGQDVWKKTTETVSTIGKKTSEAVGVIGKNADIAGKTHDLNQVFEQIGKSFAEQRPEELKAAFPELGERVVALKQEIADIEKELMEQKGCRKCTACGESIPLQAAFCPKCGASQPKAEASEEDAGPEQV